MQNDPKWEDTSPVVESPPTWEDTQPVGNQAEQGDEVLVQAPDASSQWNPLTMAKNVVAGLGGTAINLAKTAGVAASLRPPVMPLSYVDPRSSSMQPEALAKSADRPLPQQIEEAAQVGKPFDAAQDYMRRKIGITPEQEQGFISKTAQTAGALGPYLLLGKYGAPAIGAESFQARLLEDFEKFKKTMDPESAAIKARNRALASGVTQAAIFAAVPKAMRQFLPKMFPNLASRLQRAGAGAVGGTTLGVASTAAEQIIGGEFKPGDIVSSGAALGIVGGGHGALTKTPPTRPKTDDIVEQAKKVVKESAQILPQAAKAAGEEIGVDVEPPKEGEIETTQAVPPPIPGPLQQKPWQDMLHRMTVKNRLTGEDQLDMRAMRIFDEAGDVQLELAKNPEKLTPENIIQEIKAARARVEMRKQIAKSRPKPVPPPVTGIPSVISVVTPSTSVPPGEPSQKEKRQAYFRQQMMAAAAARRAAQAEPSATDETLVADAETNLAAQRAALEESMRQRVQAQQPVPPPPRPVADVQKDIAEWQQRHEKASYPSTRVTAAKRLEALQKELEANPEYRKETPNANPVESAVETVRSETPGAAAQVAEGAPGEVQEPASARPEAAQGEVPLDKGYAQDLTPEEAEVYRTQEAERQKQAQTPEGDYERKERDAMIAEAAEAEGVTLKPVDILKKPATPEESNEPFAPYYLRAKGNGVVEIDRNFLDYWLDNKVPERLRREAIRSAINEEALHNKVMDTVGARGAESYWGGLTAFEKYSNARRYLGPRYKEELPITSKAQLGHEAIRFQLQRAARLTPREFLEYSLRERLTLRTLTALEDIVRTTRKNLGTNASKQQQAILDRIESGISAAKAAVQQRDDQPMARLKRERGAYAQGQPVFSWEGGKGSAGLRENVPAEERVNPEQAGALPVNTEAALVQKSREMFGQLVGPREEVAGKIPQLPRFGDLVEWDRSNMPAPTPVDQLKTLWRERVKELIEGITPARLEELRTASGVARLKDYRRPVAAPREDIAKPGSQMALLPGVTDVTGSNAGVQSLTLRRKLADIRNYFEAVRGEVYNKLMEDAVRATAEPLKAVTVDEIDFSNPRHQPIEDIDSYTQESPKKLQEQLTPGSRFSKHRPETESARAVLVRDKSNGKIWLLSTYSNAGRSAEGNDIRIQMIVNPYITGDKPNQQMTHSWLSRFQPLLTVITKRPLKNFSQEFASVQEFNEKIGNAAREGVREDTDVLEKLLRKQVVDEPVEFGENLYGKGGKVYKKVGLGKRTLKQELEKAGYEEGEVPEGMLSELEESGEIPPLAEGTPGVSEPIDITGERSGEIAGRSRAPLTDNEASALHRVLTAWEVSSPQDMKDVFLRWDRGDKKASSGVGYMTQSEQLETRAWKEAWKGRPETKGKKGKNENRHPLGALRAADINAIIALDKIVARLERTLKREMIDEYRQAYKSVPIQEIIRKVNNLIEAKPTLFLEEALDRIYDSYKEANQRAVDQGFASGEESFIYDAMAQYGPRTRPSAEQAAQPTKPTSAKELTMPVRRVPPTVSRATQLPQDLPPRQWKPAPPEPQGDAPVRPTEMLPERAQRLLRRKAGLPGENPEIPPLPETGRELPPYVPTPPELPEPKSVKGAGKPPVDVGKPRYYQGEDLIGKAIALRKPLAKAERQLAAIERMLGKTGTEQQMKNLKAEMGTPAFEAALRKVEARKSQAQFQFTTEPGGKDPNFGPREQDLPMARLKDDWAIEDLKRRGWNTQWPFVPADLANKDFRDAIQKDPSISRPDRDLIMSFAPGGKNEIKLSLPMARLKDRLDEIKTNVEDELGRVTQVAKTMVSRRATAEDIYTSRDVADTASSLRARLAGSSVRLASMSESKQLSDYMNLGYGKLKKYTGFRKALKADEAQIEEGKLRREAAKAVLATGEVTQSPVVVDRSDPKRPRIEKVARWSPHKEGLQQLRELCNTGAEKAQKLLTTGTVTQRRIARQWLKAAKELKGEVDYAEKHWDDPEFKATVRATRTELGDSWSREKAEGLMRFRDWNYVPGRYEAEIFDDSSVLFGGRTVLGRNFRKPKLFPSYYHAVAEGPYIPFNRDIADLVEHRVRQGMRMIVRNKWIEAIKGMKDPDTNEPVAMDPVKGERGLKPPSLEYELLPLDGGNKIIAVRKAYLKSIRNAMGESSVRDNPVGGATLRFAQFLKHNGILIYDTFHPMRLGQYAMALTGRAPSWGGGWSALEFKPEQLKREYNADGSVRTPSEVERKGLVDKRAVDWALGDIKVNVGGEMKPMKRIDALRLAMKMGANVGRLQDALYGEVRTIFPGLSDFNKFVFDKLTRGLMAESIVSNFEKAQNANPTTPMDKVMRDVAKDMNFFYGNLGRQGLFKDPAVKDMMQIIMLAPQWVEGLVQKEARGASRVIGTLGRKSGVTPNYRAGLSPMGPLGMGMAKGLAAYFVLTQVLNIITRGHTTFQNKEDGKKLSAWIPVPFGEGHGTWIDPMSVFAELAHDFIRLSETKPKIWDAIDQIGRNKLGPWGRFAVTLATQKTPMGERITSTAGMAGESLKQLTPVPITFGKLGQSLLHGAYPQGASLPVVGKAFEKPYPGSVFRQMLASGGGIKSTPDKTAAQQMAQKAAHFLRENDLAQDLGDFTPTTEASASKVRSAVRIKDWDLVDHLMAHLTEKKSAEDVIRSMQNYARRPFTGSLKNEAMFLSGLSDDELDLYTDARAERMMELQAFLNHYIEQLTRP